MDQKRKVMIVDDNLIDQMITLYLLRANLAYNDILVMSNAKLAFDYLKENENNLDAIPFKIFLDLDMPVMNGFEFMKSFRTLPLELVNACQVIVLTGSDIEEDIRLIAADPNVFKLLTKPIKKSEFVPLI